MDAPTERKWVQLSRSIAAKGKARDVLSDPWPPQSTFSRAVTLINGVVVGSTLSAVVPAHSLSIIGVVAGVALSCALLAFQECRRLSRTLDAVVEMLRSDSGEF